MSRSIWTRTADFEQPDPWTTPAALPRPLPSNGLQPPERKKRRNCRGVSYVCLFTSVSRRVASLIVPRLLTTRCVTRPYCRDGCGARYHDPSNKMTRCSPGTAREPSQATAKSCFAKSPSASRGLPCLLRTRDTSFLEPPPVAFPTRKFRLTRLPTPSKTRWANGYYYCRFARTLVIEVGYR